MIIKIKDHIPSSEITDPSIFFQRRKIIKALITSVLSASGISSSVADSAKILKYLATDDITEKANATAIDLVKNYTNYYEFSFDKQESASLAQNLSIDPWTIEISGEVEKTASFTLDEILSRLTIQEYVYRFRCVEGWSMVVPWLGFSLGKLLCTRQNLIYSVKNRC